jgi:predicted ATPase/DNA-binding winged helix-turn-helix (wHTH) protein
MRPEDAAPARLRFGRFELQPTERRLLADGAPLALGARAFDMLCLLAASGGRLVSKDELLDTVWAGLVVAENNLQVQASTLRKLLGADAIATIPGRGYRFALPVRSDDAPAAAPPPAPVAAAPRGSALLQRLPALIGRDAELGALRGLCDDAPLVTLLGPGGIGKTRLAQALAQERLDRAPEAVAWVELAPLAVPALLPGAVAAAVGLAPHTGSDPLAALAAALRPLDLLLVLDNAEHLLDGVARLAQALLRGTRGVRLLVTSQAPLRLEEERVLRLDALALPPAAAGAPLTPAQALDHGAVALLVERARAADRRFALDAHNLDAVLAVCRRLDGLPLALQFAAARLPALGVQALADGLDRRFALLNAGSRGAPARHGTLQAALDWSHGLLAPEDQAVLRRLGVFAGGFTLELAVDVAAPGTPGFDRWELVDRLAALVERSLVAADGGDVPRYALSETGRAYALDRLAEAGEADALRRRHATALRARFAAAQDDWLRLPDDAWLARYAPELDNLRAALAWALAQDAETAVALVGAAAPLWHHLGLDGEARHAVEASAALVGHDGMPAALAAAWWRGAQWAWAETEPARSRAAAQQAHRLYRELGDAHGLYAQLTGEAGLWTTADEQAQAALDAALLLEQPDWPPRERAWGQRARADVARAAGRLAASRAAREAELALRIAAGDERGRQRALAHLADLALALGEPAEAVARGRELLAVLQRQRPSSTLAATLLNLVHALLVQGAADTLAEAAALAPQLAARSRDCGLLRQAADDLAWLAAARGRHDRAARLAGWSDAAHAARGAERGAHRARARAEAERLARAALGDAVYAREGAIGAAADDATVVALVG